MIIDAARRAFALAPGVPEGVRPERPTRVCTVGGEPSYWLVGGLKDGRLAALARILDDGRLATVGPISDTSSEVAAAVTGLSAAEARRRMAAVAAADPGLSISAPLLVHDGPVGREAWRSVLTGGRKAPQWVFATGGGTYRRGAGTAAGGASPERP